MQLIFDVVLGGSFCVLLVEKDLVLRDFFAYIAIIIDGVFTAIFCIIIGFLYALFSKSAFALK